MGSLFIRNVFKTSANVTCRRHAKTWDFQLAPADPAVYNFNVQCPATDPMDLVGSRCVGFDRMARLRWFLTTIHVDTQHHIHAPNRREWAILPFLKSPNPHRRHPRHTQPRPPAPRHRLLTPNRQCPQGPQTIRPVNVVTLVQTMPRALA